MEVQVQNLFAMSVDNDFKKKVIIMICQSDNGIMEMDI